MRKVFIRGSVLLLALAVVGAYGCAKAQYAREKPQFQKGAATSSAPGAPASSALVPTAMNEAAPASGAGEAQQTVAYQLPEQTAFAAASSSRRVITTAYRTVKVKDVEAGYDKAVQMVAAAGGFVQSSHFEKGTEEQERKAELVLKVPAANLGKVMDETKTLGEVLLTRTQGEDVTEQWVDLDSRIRNLKKEEDVLLDIMARQAKNLTEVLNVERELARVRGDIEQSEGRMRMLSEQVALATLNLTLVEKEIAVQALPAGLWAMKGTVTHAARTVMVALRGIVGFVIWVGILGIIWVPVLGVVVFGTRYAIKKSRRPPGQGK